MTLAWTKSSLPLSVLIRWFLDSDCSHFILVFKARDGGLMFESNLVGTHPKFLKTALKHMKIVHQIDLNITPDQENAIFDLIVDKFDGKPYNYKGFAYFCWRAVLKKAFRIPLPDKNLWTTPGSYLCEQVALALQELSDQEIAVDLTMISPEDLYYYLKIWTDQLVLEKK